MPLDLTAEEQQNLRAKYLSQSQVVCIQARAGGHVLASSTIKATGAELEQLATVLKFAYWPTGIELWFENVTDK